MDRNHNDDHGRGNDDPDSSKDIRITGLAVDMGPGTGMDTGSSCPDHPSDPGADRSDRQQIRAKKEEEMVLRKLRRLVAKYRMKKAGIRNANKGFRHDWRRYI